MRRDSLQCMCWLVAGLAVLLPGATSRGQSPLITGQPQTLILAKGNSATFAVTATDAGSLAYQWRKNLVALVNGERVTGATTHTLTISSVTAADAAIYDVVVTGSTGSTTSKAVSLCLTGFPVAAGPVQYGQLGVFAGLQPGAALIADITGIAAGGSHNLALARSGTVWAWGRNDSGQLGDGTTTNRQIPTQVIALAGVTAVAAGADHGLAVKSDGTVWAWGRNTYGQLGEQTTVTRLTPVQSTGLAGVTAVAAGTSHSLALKSDGTVWAWGRNESGQLGDGTTTTRLTPSQVPGLSNVTAIAAGGSHSLARKSDGTVWTWGGNSSGQLGDNSTTTRLSPQQVMTLADIVAIAAGDAHSLALKSDGTVWACGLNDSGQLGDGTTTSRLTPIQIPGLTNVATIAAGSHHSLATRADETTWAWGRNPSGQLGDGTTVSRLSPVQVTGLTAATALAAGESHSLALLPDGTLWAWGSSAYGQFGDGTITAGSTTPVWIAGMDATISVAAGDYHSLAAKADGTVWAWGYNNYGQLGDGATQQRLVPSAVPGLTDGVAVAAGGSHSLALKSDGTVWAWGRNNQGQLGDGTTTDRLSPVRVVGLTDVVAIAAGKQHSLAVKADGTAWAWGANGSGRLGDGTTTSRSSPVQVLNLSSVVKVAAGGSHSLAIKSDGTVWAWGYNNYGQLGIGTYDYSLHPIAAQIASLSGVIAVAAGAGHTLAVKSNGTVWAWGYNGSGQLGNGTYDYSFSPHPVPTQVSGLSGMATVAAGANFSLAAKSDGTVWTWGQNTGGQLGDGSTTDRYSPVQASGAVGAAGLAGGIDHSLMHCLVPSQAGPAVKGTWPASARTETCVTRIIVAFDRPVCNVSANDLTLSGGTVLDVRGTGNGGYVFDVADLPEGTVTATIDGDIAAVNGASLAAYAWTFTNAAQTPPTAQFASVSALSTWPETIQLTATDDGRPDTPGRLSYVITRLPDHGTLTDPGAGGIDTVPYTLVGYGRHVIYTADAEYEGPDRFDFLATDGGSAPHAGPSNTATVSVDVSSLIYGADMSTDPGWSLSAPWSYGIPAGSHDPALAHTGAHRIGYNLTAANDGDYENNLIGTRYAITPAIDCSGYSNVRLTFYRWLGIGYSGADKASVQASSDGTTWTDVWVHNSGAFVDAGWQRMQYDISAIADGKATVYIRWGIGSTDSTITYCGWNIDDVTISGKIQPRPPVAQSIERTCGSGLPWRVALHATDDGRPASPGVLTYTVVTLPQHGTLADATGAAIDTVPHTLPDHTNVVIYTASADYQGDDSFTFLADDGGTAPDAGPSDPATVALKVEKPLYFADMTSDPGWTLGTGWAYGTAVGSHDPAAAATGTRWIGYNMTGTNDGDYETGLSTARYATTPAINCAGYTNVWLRFQRSLGIEAAAFDQAAIEVSSNGTMWTKVWANGAADIVDEDWQYVEYDITAVAEDHQTVYIRWSIGPTDRVYSYAGWNIDDVLVTGKSLSSAPVATSLDIACCAAVPETITLPAQDDSLPNPPAALNYIITRLPSHGTLARPDGTLIQSVPYVLPNHANRVVYTAAANYEGSDAFDFAANDGGIAPNGGDSNVATVRIVVYRLLYRADMSANPNWTLDTGWSYGTAAGSHDPAQANTGGTWIGYNMTATNDGDYENSLKVTRYVTTPAINCTGRNCVLLSFYRWLGVEAAAYDRACIEVSSDDTTWTQVWANDTSDIVDTAWTRQEYDISAVAANKPAVRIRWGLGPTDRVYGYCGWNIDDVTVMGRYAGSIPGDANSDGYVNVGDLQVLVAAWGGTNSTTPPSGNWDSRADFNSDGHVNVGDLQILVAGWGTSAN